MANATPHTAAEIMDRCAALMNDPDKTDYTYVRVLPYLNMAINELNEHLEEANVPVTDESLFQAAVSVGQSTIVNLPLDLVEIQEVSERPAGTNSGFTVLPRKEFIQSTNMTSSLLFWSFHDNKIQFNLGGCTQPMQIQIKYIRRVIPIVTNPEELIKVINAKSYLSYKTAAFCAFYVGENQTRAEALETQAEQALERLIGISNKGRQQIMTRHRPFRAGYKSRGY